MFFLSFVGFFLFVFVLFCFLRRYQGGGGGEEQQRYPAQMGNENLLLFLKMASLLSHIRLLNVCPFPSCLKCYFICSAGLFIYSCTKPTPFYSTILFCILIASHRPLIFWFKMFMTIQADS